MELDEVKAKLTASRNLLMTKTSGLQRNDSVRKEDVKAVYQRYIELRIRLQESHPTLFDDLPLHAIPQSVVSISGDQGIYVFHLQRLMHDIDYCLELLASIRPFTESSTRITREGVFFAGQFFDALLMVNDLIRQAQKQITLIDGYIDEDILKLLTTKSSGVLVNILTKSKSSTPALSTAASAFNKQYVGLSIRTSESFHDRFMIIDEYDCYHFGASIKDLGSRGFMFSRIEEPLVINSLQSEVNREWAKAIVIV